MPITGREFERAPVKDAFEWRVEDMLRTSYPSALSVREIHERLVGPLLNSAKAPPDLKEYVRRINECMLRITDLRLSWLQVRFGYIEYRFVTLPGGRALKHWRWKKPAVSPLPTVSVRPRLATTPGAANHAGRPAARPAAPRSETPTLDRQNA